MIIDPLAWSQLDSANNPKFALCPDPVPPQTLTEQKMARQQLNFPLDRKIVVAVGPQTYRKGTDRLIQAFFKVQNSNNAVLAIIGKLDTKVRGIVDSLPQNQKDSLIIMVRFVSDEEFQSAIIASDLVAVPYRDVNRPSGIVTRCICWQRPIIASDQGWLKWAVQNFEAGFTTATETPLVFGAAIQKALAEIGSFRFSKKRDEFAEFNSQMSYKRIWQRGV